MHVSDMVLTIETLIDETSDPESLDAELRHTGFATGTRRTFTGSRGKRVYSRVVAQGLAFDSEAGAARYLEWLTEHANDVMGQTHALAFEGLPEGALFLEHLPDGCCPRETPAYLVAWRRRSFVLSVWALGPKARPGPLVPLVHAYDEEV
jgi:hypothetical protein